MKYYLISNIAIADENLNTSSFPNAEPLTLAQYNFKLANPNATIAEIKAKQLTVKVKTLDEVKAEKIAELEAAYQNWVNAGYLDTITGFTLFLDENSQIQYTKLQSIAEKRKTANAFKIGTTLGWKPIEKTPLLELLERYGEYAYPNYVKQSELKGYVEFVAQTIAEVEAVKW